jgi:1-acyl-sn-glycerol-3-phosphate acyltransferase
MTARRLAGLGRDLAVSWTGAALVAPRLAPPTRRRLARHLARRTLRTLGVSVTRRGVAPAGSEPLLVVANHVSWLDVYVLNALLDARFVAKSETAGWPLVGTITRGFDAIYIVRGSCRDAARVKDVVAAALAAGERVVAFPEATTTDGTRVLRFRAAMFQAAIDAGVRVLPVALRYPGSDGRPDPTPAFIDSMTFVESLRRVVRAPAIRAEVVFGTPLATRGASRRLVAGAAERVVRRTLGLPPFVDARGPAPALRRVS